MSLYLISCGGTGGHLAPGIALAEGLAARGHEARLLISQKKVDTRLSAKYPHLHFVRMPGAPFTVNPVGLVRFGWQQARGLAFSFRLLRELRPAGIVGFGGFTTAAIIVAARALGVPVVLHEANRVPGRAIRLLAGLARRVYLPAGVRLAGVRATAVRHAGLPVRAEIRRRPREAACVELGLDPTQKVLVVLGGSQGAAALNEWAAKQAGRLAEAGIQLYCVTGPGRTELERRESTSRTGERVAAVFAPFSDRMADLMSAADLVLSRAGAGTIAELIRCETPAILVPYPHAADNHQAANAAFFERQGGGIVVAQDFIVDLTREVLDVIFNDWLLQKFRANLQRMDRADALTVVLNDLETLTSPPSSGSLTDRTAAA